MRKKISWRNKEILCKRILEYEEEMCPLIQKKALTNKQDIFIENTLNFFCIVQGIIVIGFLRIIITSTVST